MRVESEETMQRRALDRIAHQYIDNYSRRAGRAQSGDRAHDALTVRGLGQLGPV